MANYYLIGAYGMIEAYDGKDFRDMRGVMNDNGQEYVIVADVKHAEYMICYDVIGAGDKIALMGETIPYNGDMTPRECVLLKIQKNFGDRYNGVVL